ncbi:hypothetical protein BBW65_04030 [Helicobacter enhydrae]|uniref:Uncharacterized protein n=1 Tax=Helicobacter enhydrae TaxID=222136 RepID=A0A1B1U5I4_9HELI|nr:hypothetical protein [Helicobacter enhydrae]ANV98019.1 hypothetical protein BBW65_04030 [Helicobacter enhydrae]
MEVLYKQQDKQKYFKHYMSFLEKKQLPLSYHPYIIKYFHLIAKPIEDKSFVVIENQQCVGICYCPIYEINGKKHISNNGGYTPIPIGENERITKHLFNLLDEIAIQTSCSSIRLYVDSQYSTQFINQRMMSDTENMLLLKKYGYIDTSSINTIADLTLPQEEMRKRLRKSYKPLINSYMKKSCYSIHKITQSNPNKDIHDQYVHFHHLCSGRKTRSDESFEIQYQMLLDGFATLFGLCYNKDFIGFCYFFHHFHYVTYHSGADDPKYEGSKIPIYHLILWNAFCDFHKMGYVSCNMSQPSNFSVLQGFGDYSDEKQINIASFKRGVGGGLLLLFEGLNILIKNA